MSRPVDWGFKFPVAGVSFLPHPMSYPEWIVWQTRAEGHTAPPFDPVADAIAINQSAPNLELRAERPSLPYRGVLKELS